MNLRWQDKIVLAIRLPAIAIAFSLTAVFFPDLTVHYHANKFLAILITTSLMLAFYGISEITIQKYLSVPLPDKDKSIENSKNIYLFYSSCLVIIMTNFMPDSIVQTQGFLLLFIAANIVIFHQGIFFALKELRIHILQASSTATKYSAVILLAILIVASQYNYFDPISILHIIYKIQLISFCSVVFLILIYQSYQNSKRINSKLWREFIGKISARATRRKSNLLNFIAIIALPFFLVISELMLESNGIFMILCFQPLIGISLSFSASKKLSFDLLSVGISLKLNDNQITNFILRHNSNNNYSAVITGIRTSTYFIDHDPELMLESSLPVTIQQIRTDEVDRGIHRVLGKLRLNSTTDNHRTSGVLNPEVSSRPCTDILKLFSALHLYLAPTIDRRIKGLINLFKVIDPGLYSVINEADMKNALTKNMWLFYLDYSWVDQNIITSNETTRYSLTVGTKITQAEKHTIFQYLKEKRKMGSFLIVSPQARDRLNQESLEFRNIIEAVPLNNKETGEEFLTFIIKFEDLIPKLQKYFNLDSLAKILIDFEPSVASTRQLNLVKLQIYQTKSYKKVQSIAEKLSLYTWKGYREKDAALETLVECYDRSVDLINISFPNNESQLSSQLSSNHEAFSSYIEKVGYPSQLIHSAQKKKYSLRSIDELLKVCQTPHDSRYHEAWLTLAACDSMRFSKDDIRRCITFFNDTISDKKVSSNSFIQTKCLEAFINLGKDLRRSDLDLIVSLFNQLANNLINIKASADLCCLILDGRRVLEQKIRGRIRFDENNERVLSLYFKHLGSTYGEKSTEVASLLSRWDNYISDTK